MELTNDFSPKVGVFRRFCKRGNRLSLVFYPYRVFNLCGLDLFEGNGTDSMAFDDPPVGIVKGAAETIVEPLQGADGTPKLNELKSSTMRSASCSASMEALTICKPVA